VSSAQHVRSDGTVNAMDKKFELSDYFRLQPISSTRSSPKNRHRKPSSRAPKLGEAELRFHPTEEMRLSALLGPQHPVAARAFHLRREGGHQRALCDKLRKKIA
jgi:hypothetical protein